jgi:hypothetical protein
MYVFFLIGMALQHREAMVAAINGVCFEIGSLRGLYAAGLRV